MTAFENAKKFFLACDAPLGWAECKQYVADGASFVAQCEPLVEAAECLGSYFQVLSENSKKGGRV